MGIDGARASRAARTGGAPGARIRGAWPTYLVSGVLIGGLHSYLRSARLCRLGQDAFDNAGASRGAFAPCRASQRRWMEGGRVLQGMVEAVMVGVDGLRVDGLGVGEGGRRRTADRMVLDAVALLVLRHFVCLWWVGGF
jgi:hypothetical protein